MTQPKMPANWTARGYRWHGNRIVTPEGRNFGPEDLNYLALVVGIKQEWVRMMDLEKIHRKPKPAGNVIYLREVLAGARERVLTCL